MKLTGWLRYRFERWMLRGSPAMLVSFIAVLALLATGGALVGYLLPGHHFETYDKALWWAVLRISDPGYLSDDIADFNIRALSAVLSVLGMSLTVGGIVAIVTQAVNGMLRKLATATTPVPFSDHVVLLGWTDRTPRLLHEILESYRGKIVVLIEKVGPEEVRRLARSVPRSADVDRIVLRRGNLLRRVDLTRAACADARVIIMSASAQAAAGDPQAGPKSLKTLLVLRSLFEESAKKDPLVVVEVVDRTLVNLAEATLSNIRVLHSDKLISRALRIGLQGQNMLSTATNIIRPNEGWALASREGKRELGKSLEELDSSTEGEHLLGIRRGAAKKETLLAHGADRVAEEDHLLYLRGPVLQPLGHLEAEPEALRLMSRPPKLSVLILGWNEIAPDLLAELALEEDNRYEVDVLSGVPPEERRRSLADVLHIERVPGRQLEGDPLLLEAVPGFDASKYDRVVVLSDRANDPESSDARTLAVVLELARYRDRMRDSAYVLVELLEPEDFGVVLGVEALISPKLIADVLVSVALSPQDEEAVTNTLSLHRVLISRIFEVPSDCQWSAESMRRQLRKDGKALIQFLPASESGQGKRAVIVEAARH